MCAPCIGLCDAMDCSLPRIPLSWVFRQEILEWLHFLLQGIIVFLTQDQTCTSFISYLEGGLFNTDATCELVYKSLYAIYKVIFTLCIIKMYPLITTAL